MTKQTKLNFFYPLGVPSKAANEIKVKRFSFQQPRFAALSFLQVCKVKVNDFFTLLAEPIAHFFNSTPMCSKTRADAKFAHVTLQR